MLAVAIGLVLGMLCSTAGVLLFVAAFLFTQAGPGVLLGLMGGAFGCFFGGLGSLAGSWNTYRQLHGKIDWMRIAGRTVLDYALAGYGLFGLVLLVLGILCRHGLFGPTATDWSRAAAMGLSSLGGLVLFQAVVFWRVEFPSCCRLLRLEIQQHEARQPFVVPA